MSAELKRLKTFPLKIPFSLLGVLLSFAKPPYISFLGLFCLSSASSSRANYSMSCLSNSEAFVPLALRLIGLCGLPESRCSIIDAVFLFSVYTRYMNILAPLLTQALRVSVCLCAFAQ